MGYGIVRVKKIKSTAALSGALRHNTREKPPRNADPERTKDNFSYATLAEAMKRFKDLLPEKRRKDATLAVEIVITASPHSFKDKKQESSYLMDGLKWLEKRMGGNKNTLSLDVHWDEATGHLHHIFIPLKNGRLNAKGYIGGPAELRKLQDDFYNDVSKKYGLERGVSKEITKRTHTKPGEYPKVMAKLIAKETQLLATEEKLKARDQAVTAVINNQDAKGKLAVQVLENLNGTTEPERERFWPRYRERLPNFIKGIVNEVRTEIKQENDMKKDRKQERGRGR